MKPRRPFDPLRLDIAAFAAAQGRLEGEWPLEDLRRLADSGNADARATAHEKVHWQAEGETRPRPGDPAQAWLHLEADGAVWMQCQRCLQPVREVLEVERSFRFVRDEAQAEAEDAGSEEDVLALRSAFDLRALVEDELLLALPLVPRHEVCPQPLPQPSPQEPDPLQSQEEATAPHPFAKLAALKRGKSSH